MAQLPVSYDASGASGSAGSSKRLSTTLQDKSLLRGTPPATLLTGFGKHLRTTAGGIGAVAEEDENTYDESAECTELDAFFSHSWHASWRLKYLALLFYFNALPACAVTVVVSLALGALPEGVWPHRRIDSQFEGCWTLSGDRWFVEPAGWLVFLLTLTCWHHATKAAGCCVSYMFFDKVCIHQTDSNLKEQGIKSIGAFLKNSKVLLVAWDSTYFDRLWCTFELSAFFFAKAEPEIRVVPVQLGGVVLAVLLSNAAICVVSDILDASLGSHAAVAVFSILKILPFCVVTRWVRKYLRHLAKLDRQLATFSVRGAKCFCCAQKHVHPDTHAPIPCDRELVEEAIAQWHGGGDRAKGLKEFDFMVNGRFRRDMNRTLGKDSMVPYTFALLIGIPYFLHELDYAYQAPLWHRVVYCLHCLLGQWPLSFFVYLQVVGYGVEKTSSRLADRIVFVSLGIISACMWKLLDMVSNLLVQCSALSCYSWLAAEIVIVCYLYRGGCVKRDERSARHRGESRPRSARTSVVLEMRLKSQCVSRNYDFSM